MFQPLKKFYWKVYFNKKQNVSIRNFFSRKKHLIIKKHDNNNNLLLLNTYNTKKFKTFFFKRNIQISIENERHSYIHSTHQQIELEIDDILRNVDLDFDVMKNDYSFTPKKTEEEKNVEEDEINDLLMKISENENELPKTLEEELFFLDYQQEEDEEQTQELINYLIQKRSHDSNFPNMDEAKKRQIALEVDAITKATKKYEETINVLNKLGRGACFSKIEKLMIDWYEPLKNLITKDQKEAMNGTSLIEGVKENLELLLALNPSKLAVITMHTVLGTFLRNTNDKIAHTSLAISIGEVCQAEWNIELLKMSEKKLAKWVETRGSTHKINRVARSLSYKQKLPMQWNARELAWLGSNLISRLCQVARVTDANGNYVPAILHEHEWLHNRQYGINRASEALKKKIAEIFEDTNSKLRDIITPKQFPMIVEPRKWIGPTKGGYLQSNSEIMRLNGYKPHLFLLWKATKNNELNLIFKALNILSKTAWKLNTEMYDIIEEAWKQGGGIADLPPKKDVDYPPRPSEPEKIREWNKLCRKIKQHNQDLHSLRCDIRLKLGVAREFKDEEKFYFPHNMDFRGRTYPIPPHLNHLGSDLCRSLLLFKEGKPLGKRGLYWIKIHLANLSGRDKISFNDRIKFVDENMDNIIDSADYPLTGKRWWLNADSPWQCLNTCRELVKILRSSDPENYICYLPVHQDGTCNGLQHYAALGRDLRGAQQVNLTPGPAPADVYSGICKLVNERIENDARLGNPLGILLRGKIDRKIVKQTVMTTVYGVTFVGATKQIRNAMKDRNICAEDELWRCSHYIAKHVFASIGEVFKEAQTIMSWLTECARIIGKAGYVVKWKTPLGLPVVQPYKKTNGHSTFVKTIVQTICLAKDPEEIPVNSMRQRSAFPPNYVHSLDSTHMMMTALEMDKLNLTFAAVHDSYWTHPCSIDTMNYLLRKAFVDLYNHSPSPLEALYENFKKEYPELAHFFPSVPSRGSLDLNEVMKSPYFFN